MKEPRRARYAPLYDLFKLIVAVILTVVLILLLLMESRSGFKEATSAPLSTPTISPAAAMDTSTLETSSPEITETAAASTSTPAVIAAQTTETPPVESPVQVEPSPAATPTSETTSTPDPNACPANPTRIKAGDRVKVLDWLNFREGPGLNYRIWRTNRPGAQMDVIGGPVCVVKGDDPPRAYLWWNVRMENGEEGWSAEAPLNFPNYFMEPVR